MNYHATEGVQFSDCSPSGAPPIGMTESKNDRRDNATLDDTQTALCRLTARNMEANGDMMADLIVVGFPDNIHRSSGVIDELRVLDDKWISDIHHALAVHRELTGALHMDQSYRPTGRQGDDWGAALGFVIGATLALPFTVGADPVVRVSSALGATLGGAALAAAGAGRKVAFGKDAYGLPDVFLRDVSDIVRPGDSAVYALLKTEDVGVIAARFQALGGVVRKTELSAEEQAKIEQAVKSQSG